MSLPVNLVSVGLAAATNKIVFGNRYRDDFGRSPAMLLLLPNSSLRWRLLGNVRLIGGFNTDYLLLKKERTRQGILSEQFMGLSLTKEAGPDQSGSLSLEFRLVHNHFINFEGADHEDGWSCCFSLNVGGLGLIAD